MQLTICLANKFVHGFDISTESIWPKIYCRYDDNACLKVKNAIRSCTIMEFKM